MYWVGSGVDGQGNASAVLGRLGAGEECHGCIAWRRERGNLWDECVGGVGCSVCSLNV